MRSKDIVQARFGGKTALQSVVGGVVASAGLELFLHPHELIAGGMTGISALVSFHTEKQFGLLLLLFNLPLLLLYSFLGRKTAFRSVLPGLLAFSGSALLFAPLPAVSGEPVIAALAGGFCLGIGAGLAVKSGGLLDSLGLEHGDQIRPRIIMSSKLSPKHALVLCHAAVLVLAGAVMGWERTLYSALACIAAYETSAFMLWGMRRTVWVAVSRPDEVRIEVRKKINLDGELLTEHEGGDAEKRIFLRYAVHILDVPRFKAAVNRSDPGAEMIWLLPFELKRRP
ncbi:YitT family protein [Paenibacillus sp. VCA1]|uniref:YitT family protein n=1 Tax=Paenibacillus sp. VCA1 TaxID=3039148 RepID=UPI0028725DB9|nr:YitT family protein [Paenibacillus sp. VCA1]MDR9854921.1 YitT family protein [Paenibacillus sp. VCA1]